jgi:hypothetical protein
MAMALVATLVTASLAIAGAQSKEKRLRADLSGGNEVPAVSSVAHGEMVAQVDAGNTEFSYELTFDGLEGAVTQAHIHFAQAGVNGGIMIFLCGTPVSPGPAGTPTCPTPGGSVSGTVGAAQVIGPAGQGISAGEWEEALAAIRAGLAYANLHSTKWPGGEIRGQINTPR